MGDAIRAAGDEEGGERLRRGIDDRSRSMREQGVGESKQAEVKEERKVGLASLDT